jgi:hypothetical protein
MTNDKPVAVGRLRAAAVLGAVALFLVVLLASRGLTDSDHVDGREERP